MYVNPAFKTAEDTAWDYVTARGFGAVVAHHDGRPQASHVPLLVTVRDGVRRLEFHLARPNPLIAALEQSPRVLVVVSGPDAYISPDWYASDDQVPTWNYLAAHISGQARAMAREATLDHVERMSLHFEARLAPKKPWSTVKMSARRREMMLAAIVAMEVEVDAIEASTKLGQNKSVADRMEAARMLSWRGGWGEAAVAEAMRAELRKSQSKEPR
jgi:transcriptional regulator